VGDAPVPGSHARVNPREYLRDRHGHAAIRCAILPNSHGQEIKASKNRSQADRTARA
jgi:hypothetical protein